jgi:hypothetical protein
MVTQQNPCKYHKKEVHHNEKHPHSLYMVLLATVSREIYDCVSMACPCNLESCDLESCLEQQHEPKLTVIQFSNTPANPEAMVVELPDTLLALITMSASIRHHHLTFIAKPFLRLLPSIHFIMVQFGACVKLEHWLQFYVVVFLVFWRVVA